MELAFESIQHLYILTASPTDFKQRLARTELRRGLLQAGYKGHMVVGELPGPEPEPHELRFLLLADAQGGEQYTIACRQESSPSGITVTIQGASKQALIYGVFAFLERQGAFFSLDGDHYPLDHSPTLHLPEPGQNWSETPRFSVRGLQPWPDFLNCISVFNREDYRAYLEAMLRMRFNMLGIHVYMESKEGEKWVEPFLSFEYGGIGHAAFADTTATDRWGYLPQCTSRYAMGASQYFDHEVFGTQAALNSRTPWEEAELAQKLWRDAFAYAEQLGIRTGVGFEPYLLPDEIRRACPPEVQIARQIAHGQHTVKGIDPESRTARTLLETRLARLLETYPSVSYIYLWEDELTSWNSQRYPEQLSVTPFRQAYDFLRRHAPEKRLVLAGWGGVVRNFAAFHRALPEEIIFTCLSDQFGLDPVHEAFAKLEGRERWPILWIEDDPSMWFPQYHVHRFARDIKLAEEYECQGLLGIHWRHRIIEPTANFQARRSWDQHFTPTQLYRSYARTQASANRAPLLADLLQDADQNRHILSTDTGERLPDGRAAFREFSGDYNEVFLSRYEDYPDVPPTLLATQQELIRRIGHLLREATNPEERERLSYLYGQLAFLDPYARAWQCGACLQRLAKEQYEFKKAGGEVSSVVCEQALAMWLELLGYVRLAVLAFQHTVATRSDLGTLASIHNKFVRIATFRLRASLEELIGELPPEARAAADATLAPDDELVARVFIPTRPTLLAPGETVTLTAIAPGMQKPCQLTLYWRLIGADPWRSLNMKLTDRRTYATDLRMPDEASFGIEYYVEATYEDPSLLVTAPISAPEHRYLITI